MLALDGSDVCTSLFVHVLSKSPDLLDFLDLEPSLGVALFVGVLHQHPLRISLNSELLYFVQALWGLVGWALSILPRSLTQAPLREEADIRITLRENALSMLALTSFHISSSILSSLMRPLGLPVDVLNRRGLNLVNVSLVCQVLVFVLDKLLLTVLATQRGLGRRQNAVNVKELFQRHLLLEIVPGGRWQRCL